MEELSKQRYQKRTKKQVKPRANGLLYFKVVQATCDLKGVIKINALYPNMEDIKRHILYR
jgi:hypothetical protein